MSAAEKLKGKSATIIVLVPKDHWKAVKAHAYATTGRRTGGSGVIRTLIAKYVKETGALRQLQAERRKRRKRAADRTTKTATKAKPRKRAASTRRKTTKRRAA